MNLIIRSLTPRPRAALWLLISLCLTSALLFPGRAVVAEDPSSAQPSGGPVERTVSVGETLVDAWSLGVRPAGHPKLASSLNGLLERRRRLGLGAAQGYAAERGMVLSGERVQVVVVAGGEFADDAAAATEVLGGQIQARYETLVQALVPIGALEALAGRPGVQFVREPHRPTLAAPMRVGAETSEGVAVSNTSAWHDAGYDGTGVRVAVIDAGFTGYVDLLGTDLPASVNTYDWTSSGMEGSPHGTACAEIVHDMAPGAAIDLHKVGTDVELAQAVSQAITDGVDVISMSLGWTIDGPGDGTGFLAGLVANARSNGILYATAAGNEAEVSWSGTYVNHNPGTNDYHAWNGVDLWFNFMGSGDGTCYVFFAGVPLQAGLHWDDWAGNPTQDYDLHLYRWPGGDTIYRVASSTEPQNGGPGQTPEEYISYTAEGDNCYAWVIERVSATRDVCLRMNAPKTVHLDQWTPARSLTFPADSPDAVTVAALDVTDPYPLEPYSSQGPTFGPGGACSGGSAKPDIAAYANVSSVSYGAGVFNGTSAATPHVAGAAALVKQRFPGYSLNEWQTYLEDEALDLGDPGKDSLSGAGRLFLPGINRPPNQPSNPAPADGAIGVPVTTTLSWTGGDPDASDTVTYTVYLEADDNTPEVVVCDDLSATTCDPGPLDDTTQYFWRVDASDNHGASTTGLVWGFATGEPNNAPNVPRDPAPADGAIGVPVTTTLAWTGGDPDAGDTVTYTVYLEPGDSSPEVVVCDSASATTCDPGPLEYGTHYAWRVDASDNHGASATGALWGFETPHVVYLPLVSRE
jgi:subtilisin family serine protease